MQQVTIDKYRIVPAPTTGIGWVSVEVWDNPAGQYKHLSTYRSQSEADTFIENLERSEVVAK